MHSERRRFPQAGAAAVLLPHVPAAAQTTPLLRKRISARDEEVPIIGLGTARRRMEDFLDSL